jgi:hypothetical protein
MELAFLGPIEHEHNVCGALDHLPVSVHSLCLETEAVVRPINLKTNGEVGRLEAYRRPTVPAGVRHVTEGADGQSGTTKEGESDLGHCRVGQCHREKNCHQYANPEFSHKLSYGVAYRRKMATASMTAAPHAIALAYCPNVRFNDLGGTLLPSSDQQERGK